MSLSIFLQAYRFNASEFFLFLSETSPLHTQTYKRERCRRERDRDGTTKKNNCAGPALKANANTVFGQSNRSHTPSLYCVRLY